MENSALTKLLRSFSKNEMKEFYAFVKSPYFNNEKVLIRFTEILLDYFPDFKILKRDVFRELYPGKNYHDALMRNIQSDLLRMSEDFLSVKNFLEDKITMKQNLLSQLSKRNLQPQFLKQHAAVERLLDNFKIRDSGYFLKRFLIDSEYALFIERNVDSYMRDTRSNTLLQNLTVFFAMNFTYHRAAVINREKIIQIEEKDLLPETEIESIIAREGNFLLQYPYMKVYYYIYRILKDESEEHFQKLKEFSEKNLEQVYEADRMGIFTALSNFAYLKVLSGDVSYTRKQFEILITAAKSGAYKFNKGFLPHIQYMNVVVTGLEVNEIEEVETFAVNYCQELLSEFREPSLHFCKALIAYKKELYEDSIRELSQVEIEDFSFKQQIKSLYLKIYFDMNETEAFYYHIDSYKHFVRGNRDIHALVRKQLINYVNYSKKIFDIKIRTGDIDEAKLNEVETKIKNNNTLINKKWLLEKIGELKNRK